MEYVLQLSPTEGASVRRTTTLHLLLSIALGSLGVSCLLLYWFTAKAVVFNTAYWYSSLPPGFKSANSWFALFGLCASAAAICIFIIVVRYRRWLQAGRRNAGLRLIEVVMLSAACLLFALTRQAFPAYIFGFLTMMISVVMAMELRSPEKPQALITESGIRLPKGGSGKSFRWKEIEAVRIRHGILSLELSGNRLIQRSLVQDAEAAEIEAFCRQHIIKHEKARAAANAW